MCEIENLRTPGQKTNQSPNLQHFLEVWLQIYGGCGLSQFAIGSGIRWVSFPLSRRRQVSCEAPVRPERARWKRRRCRARRRRVRAAAAVGDGRSEGRSSELGRPYIGDLHGTTLLVSIYQTWSGRPTPHASERRTHATSHPMRDPSSPI